MKFGRTTLLASAVVVESRLALLLLDLRFINSVQATRPRPSHDWMLYQAVYSTMVLLRGYSKGAATLNVIYKQRARGGMRPIYE